ncbi:DUF1638 domain-containing protein [Myxococcota bacterium]|nr:DUF1638 domain-containing protein [Myxococcota bacterium]MBU1382249.1 DUF1638 domain-containing protein [Myxococcota bacterium]MBU1496646.1 DUF1638 domain-containing protein [Myxococcota bacterium]
MEIPHIICCGILETEVRRILSEDYPGLDAVFCNSILHMKPESLQGVLNEKIKPGYHNILLYGDCAPHISDLEKQPDFHRPPVVNCIEMLLGPDLYRSLRRDRAFFMMHEWSHRWREIFIDEMGFSSEKQAGIFLRENCSRIIYLDTGSVEIPHDIIEDISTAFEISVEIESVSLDTLRSYIKNIISETGYC